MTVKVNTVEAYINQLEPNRADIIQTLLSKFEENLPAGFKLKIQYNLPTFVIPKSLYPNGYHVNPKLPLPFISIAAQKHHVAIYHFGLYMDEDLFTWFKTTYEAKTNTRLDIGKSCIRFKKADMIPYDILAELATKITPDKYITMYEQKMKR